MLHSPAPLPLSSLARPDNTKVPRPHRVLFFKISKQLFVAIVAVFFALAYYLIVA